MNGLSTEKSEELDKILSEKFPTISACDSGNKQVARVCEIAIGDEVAYTLPNGVADTEVYIVTDINYTIRSSDGVIQNNIKRCEIEKQ